MQRKISITLADLAAALLIAAAIGSAAALWLAARAEVWQVERMLVVEVESVEAPK